MPDYWRVLTEVVPPEKGLPHFRKVRISGLKSTGAQRAFAVSSYAESPLVDFEFKDIEIEAKTAGTIANTQGWKMEDMPHQNRRRQHRHGEIARNPDHLR